MMDPLRPQTGGLIATTPYRSGHTRAQITVFLLVASIVTALLSPLASYIQVWLPNAISGGGEADATASADDAGGLVIALLFLGTGLSIIAVFVATVVAFLMWIHRAYSNLTALGNAKEGLEYSPGWAVGGFFIPFVNLVVPYRVAREIWVKSEPEIRSEQDWMFSSSPETPGGIKLWWAFWLLSNFANNILFRLSGNAETPEALLWEGHLSAGVAVLEIIAAVLAIKVVRGIDRRQEERRRHVTFAYAVPPPPTPPTPRPTPGTQF